MTVTTALPHAEAVALADRHLADWLKQEGCEEPPSVAPAPVVTPSATFSARPPVLSPDVPASTDVPAADRPGRGPVAERLRLGDRVLLDRDSGSLRPGFLPATGSGAGPGRDPDTGRYDRRRLRTPAPHGTGQLTLTVATGPAGPTWVRLEAETHTTDSGVRTPCRVPVPELARTLLPLLDAADGPVAVQTVPRVLTVTGVDDLIDELCDPDRRMPTVVASVPVGHSVGEWMAEVVGPLSDQLPGLATVYVLDPGARTRFNVALEHHAVYGGAVRTYLPEVDPASRQDGARHPVLARRRIEEDLRRAAGLLAREPRRIAAELPLPPVLAAVPVLRVVPSSPRPATRSRTENQAPASYSDPAPTGSPGHPAGSPAGTSSDRAAAGPDAVAGAESAALAHEERQDLAEQQARADELERVRHSLRRERRRAGRGRAPSGRLCTFPTIPGGAAGPAPVAAGAGSPTSRGCPPPAPAGAGRRSGRRAAPTDTPATFTELMARLGEFPLLTFTGDQKAAIALDELRCTGTGWARLTWDGLTALQEYAEAAVRGRAGGDFKQWCERTPAGCHRFPPRKAVRGESRTVFSHTKWKRERMLPVPECVDASRRAFMGAHLRIGGGRTAPRLHYLDDCSGSGRIYVGYIGLHLTNTRTN
ncbi:hypothetical protein [Streptomyces sp. BE303]|uniref:hypothetical protein n=1 Tax=Streptomyces sp. BE303 TaxID=3002528 RepID=UPI002E782FDD|nr:hypothetical protein [Streptomyces sp. BE303]MED7954878.1 hypothetical protein [Streptomyces sp. BE303]